MKTRHHAYEVLTRLKVEARSGGCRHITNTLANRVWPEGIEYAGTPPYDGPTPPNWPASRVYLLPVGHKHGTNHWVCATHDIARRHLFEDDVKLSWVDLFKGPVPGDEDAAIERDSHEMTSAGEECYTIEPLELLST